jgi:hypothetical protein
MFNFILLFKLNLIGNKNELQKMSAGFLRTKWLRKRWEDWRPSTKNPHRVWALSLPSLPSPIDY